MEVWFVTKFVDDVRVYSQYSCVTGGGEVVRRGYAVAASFFLSNPPPLPLSQGATDVGGA